MNRLASTIAELVRNKLSDSHAGSAGELRLIFHGPPMEILSQVFDLLVVDDRQAPVPILLQLPSLAAGEENPAVGASGRCDDTHLSNLRNSPSQPTFLALVPPGPRTVSDFVGGYDGSGGAIPAIPPSVHLPFAFEGTATRK